MTPHEEPGPRPIAEIVNEIVDGLEAMKNSFKHSREPSTLARDIDKHFGA